jgi:hypothetical protein
MPELGPYGSMRGEVRENLPYRDFETEDLHNEIKALCVSKVSLAAETGQPILGAINADIAPGAISWPVIAGPSVSRPP